MIRPTPNDPMGQRPDPTSVSEMLEGVVDARIKMHLTGRTSEQFDGVPDLHLVHELLARGWAVFRPRTNE